MTDMQAQRIGRVLETYNSLAGFADQLRDFRTAVAGDRGKLTSSIQITAKQISEDNGTKTSCTDLPRLKGESATACGAAFTTSFISWLHETELAFRHAVEALDPSMDSGNTIKADCDAAIGELRRRLFPKPGDDKAALFMAFVNTRGHTLDCQWSNPVELAGVVEQFPAYTTVIREWAETAKVGEFRLVHHDTLLLVRVR